MSVQAIAWSPSGAVRIVDQRALPEDYGTRDLESVAAVADAIRHLQVRGAPLIGIAAAMGLVAGLRDDRALARGPFLAKLEAHAALLAATRPTAVNLRWALDRMLAAARDTPGEGGVVWDRLQAEATAIWEEDRAMCRKIGEHGLALLPDGTKVLTHCNAGARPTAWELTHAGIPCTVIADAAAGALMRAAQVDVVLVGADRIARNGDFANKIGTYGLAVLAFHHSVPFYCCAPSSTIDLGLADGDAIPIEQRPAEEVKTLAGRPVAPAEAGVLNPAFDVTPARYVTGYITDRGIVKPPFRG